MLHQNCDVDSSSFSFGLIHLAFGRCGWMEVFSKFSEMRSLCLILVYFVLYLNTARGKLMHPDTYLNIVSNPYTQKYKASWRLYTRYLILIGLNFLYEFENNSFTFVFSNKNGFFFYNYRLKQFFLIWACFEKTLFDFGTDWMNE